MSAVGRFFSELKRRRVIRVAVVYALVAWLLIQVAEVTFEPLQLPGWTITFVVWLAGLGFPLALVLAWAFDLTPEGIKRDTGTNASAAGEMTALRIAAGAELVAEDDTASIAVLPFVDMSPDRDQAYFCEGVAEEILNSLAMIPELRVASRTSSFQYEGRAADIRAIGQDLNVKTVLEGSVRKAEDQLRITAQLINVEDGYHLWSGSFDREMCDIFAIQAEIAESIVDALQLKLAPTPHGKRQDCVTCDVEAYDYYLRGRQFFARYGRKELGFAIDMFKRAIEIDENYPLAWAGLADSYSFCQLYVQADDETVENAMKASKRALDLAPDLAEAHASRGLALMLDKRYAEAEVKFEKAIELNPKQFEAYYFYARASVHQGKMAEAEEYFRKASEVRPEDYQSLLLLSRIYSGQGRLDEAKDAARRGIEVAENHLRLNPDDARALYLMASPYLELGEPDRAREVAERALAIDPNHSVILYNVACYYAQTGELDRALDCLEGADMPAMANRAWIEHDEDLAPLRGHPRFDALVAELK